MALLDELVVREALETEIEAAKTVVDAAFDLVRHVYRPRGHVAAHEAARAALGTRLVAIFHGAVVGTVQFEVHSGHVHLIGLAVAPPMQNRGIARALVSAVASRAPQLGRDVIALDTVRETGNVEKFLALGFSVVSEAVTSLFESSSHPVLHEVKMERTVGSAAAS